MSSQEKLERNKKPRVHIKYEVEEGGASVERDLPFVVGVMGDFSGNNSPKEVPLKQRKFISLDKVNFTSVMEQMAPSIKYTVDDVLSLEGEKLNVDLSFRSMQDFEPDRLVDQIPKLKDLKKTRDLLRDLLSKADCSEELETLLEEALVDRSKLNMLASDIKKLDGHNPT